MLKPMVLTPAGYKKDLDATTKHMPDVLIALLLTIAANEIGLHIRRRAKCLNVTPAVVDANYLTFLRLIC